MIRTILLILSFILIVIGFGPFVQAQMTDGPIVATDVRAFATAPTAKTGAVFMTLTNKGGEDDTLTGASSDVAEINEIHENIIDPDDGKMMMRKVSGITVPANGSVVLKPHGYHVMLIKLKEGLKEGGEFPLTLTFEKAGTMVVETKIVAPGESAMKPMDHMEKHGDMNHDSMDHGNMSHEGH